MIEVLARTGPVASSRDSDTIIGSHPTPRPRRGAIVAVFLSSLAIYLAAAWNLAIVHHAIVGDAMARVANGSYVLMSRDPHLAAVGFVWNPLPSLTAAALLPFSAIWPALRTQAFAGNIVSAIAMAGAAALIWRQLREYGLRAGAAAALTACFALHPLVMQYGANGDSEAMLLCFLALACLGMTRYLERRDLTSLATVGCALGLGYLSRQEFLAAGAATVLCVAMVAYRSGPGVRAHRRWRAATDGTLAALPLLFAIACWAGSALVIVGTATSYLDVNSEQVDAARAGIGSVVGGPDVFDRGMYFLGQLVQLEPAWSVLLVITLVLACRRRDARVVAPLATFGAVALAQGLLFAAGSTFGWLRFAMTIVPLTVLLGGLALAPHPANRRAPRGHVRLITVATVVGCCVLAVPVAVRAMTNPRWGREEAASVHLLPGYGWAPVGASAYEPGWLDEYDTVARWFDARDQRRGPVLTDAQYTFPLVLKSDRPTQFVIPSDTDFERSLADPATYRVGYLLVSDGVNDAIVRSYPELRSQPRTGTAVLVRTFRAGPNRLRLYRVTASITGSRGGAPSS